MHLIKHTMHKVPILSDKYHFVTPCQLSYIIYTWPLTSKLTYWHTYQSHLLASMSTLYSIHFFCLAVKLSFNSVNIWTLRITGFAFCSIKCHYMTLRLVCSVPKCNQEYWTHFLQPPKFHKFTSIVTIWNNFWTLSDY